MIRMVTLCAVLALLAGCGVTKQVVRVDSPAHHINPESGSLIVVHPVQDERTDAIVMKFPAADRARNVGGVLRGGNGIEVNLADATAAYKVHALVVQALRGMGYRTVEKCNSQCAVMDVALTQFSVQMPFNFWRAASYSQHMVADLSAVVSVSDAGTKHAFTVVGHGSNIYQRAVPENWQVALDRAAADFSHNFQAAMSVIE